MATTRSIVRSEVGNVFVVTIRVNAQGQIETVPPKFDISKGNFDQVFWQSEDPNTRFEIKFGGDAPFAYREFSNDQPYSGLVRRDVQPPQEYKYTVSIEDKRHDPGGIVNP